MTGMMPKQTREQRQADMDLAHYTPVKELEWIMFEGVAEVADGCIVEPDGYCPHGHRSPLVVLGLI